MVPGWQRKRGTCYAQLGRLDLAETALNDALNQTLSARRRGSVLTDLAMIGVHRRDYEQLVMYASAALDMARQTGSGVIGRKLHGLQDRLTPFLDNTRVREIHQQITSLTR
jgi:hypothetical protein